MNSALVAQTGNMLFPGFLFHLMGSHFHVSWLRVFHQHRKLQGINFIWLWIGRELLSLVFTRVAKHVTSQQFHEQIAQTTLPLEGSFKVSLESNTLTFHFVFCDVSADVGGFFNNPDPELLVRWYQVSPFALIHDYYWNNKQCVYPSCLLNRSLIVQKCT